jgi:selenocysteine lyase/cysteine desulfurase
MEAIQRRLHASNIHVMAQAGRMRVSIHGYNTVDDIEHLLSTLSGALRHVAAS